MRIAIIFLSFLFFTTQIIPVKYMGYMCNKAVCSLDNSDIDDDDELHFKVKKNIGKETFFTNIFLVNTSIKILKKSTNIYAVFCIQVPKDYIQTIIAPPPNC